MRVLDLVAVPIRSGYFRDDQAAILGGARHDGFPYVGPPATPGFRAVREAGRAVSLMLVLDDGRVALGECAEVQYAGVGGRSSLLDPDAVIDEVERVLRPALLGREIGGFRHLADEVDALTCNGRPLSPPLRYGISQGLLDAAAQAAGSTMAEVVRDEYETGVELAPRPLYAQSGDDRYLNVDKMILKRVDVIPHGLINTVDGKLGRHGELLEEYVAWVRARIQQLGAVGYRPVLHFDVYGTVGMIFDGDLEAVATYLARLVEVARPFRLRIEHPVDAGDREGQIATFATLRRLLAARRTPVELVADEWCNTLEDIRAFVAADAVDMIQVKAPDLGGIGNTVEALLEVRRAGIGAFAGGTCNETDVSARVCAQVAMACGVDQVLAKPGMGLDEGLMIVSNEMARTAALATARGRARAPVGTGTTLPV